MMGVRMNPEDVFRLVDKHNGRHGSIISILEDIQAQYNFLPRRALRIVASRTGRPLVDIYALATFYRSFSLKPKGRHMVSVCMGTACHVRRSPDVLAGFCQRLNIRPGETTGDREFSLSTVNCLGACALGPVTVIDGEYYRNVKKNDIPAILEHACRDENILKMTADEEVFAVNVSSVRRKHGWVRLSSLYGDYRIESEYEIPPGAIAHFFCPSCHTELKSGRLCATCDAPMIILFVRGGGTVQFCSRRGCKEHILDLVDEEDMRT
jgi:NADH-quinone oxidoreductase subunit E